MCIHAYPHLLVSKGDGPLPHADRLAVQYLRHSLRGLFHPVPKMDLTLDLANVADWYPAVFPYLYEGFLKWNYLKTMGFNTKMV